MTYAIPSNRFEPNTPGTTRGYAGRQRIATRPRGLGLVGLGALLVGIWGAIVPYVGPEFGYRSNGLGSFDWTTQHWLLYLLPGGVAAICGLVILSSTSSQKRARGPALTTGLLLLLSGAWFVLGPSVWPMLTAHPALHPVFAGAPSALAAFTNVVGYNLGVGILLACFGGMALKSVLSDRQVDVQELHESNEMAAPTSGVSLAPGSAVTAGPAGEAGAGTPVPTAAPGTAAPGTAGGATAAPGTAAPGSAASGSAGAGGYQ